MLIYSWFCCIFYLTTSLLWKNEYLKWNVWHSIVFCPLYFFTICLVCINQNIFHNKFTFAKWCSNILKGIVIFWMAAVLFGAPLIQRQLDTFMWACLMSLLCCLPSASMFDVYQLKQPPATSVIIIVSTLLGSWFGAFVVPLDWEKPWQVWPIPCNFGAVVGHLLGITLKLLLEWHSIQTKSAKRL